MKLRRIRKLRQEMHGYWNVVSFRIETGGPDPYTGKVWPKSSMRASIGTGNKPWRAR